MAECEKCRHAEVHVVELEDLIVACQKGYSDAEQGHIATIELLTAQVQALTQERDEANQKAAKWHQRMLLAKSQVIVMREAVGKYEEKYGKLAE